MIEKILKDWKKRVGNNLDYKNTDHLFELGSMLTEQGWDSKAIGILIENLKEIDIVRKKQPDGSFGSAYTVKKHNPDRGQQLVKKDASPEDLEKVDKGEPIDTEKDNADGEREKIGGKVYTEPLEITDKEFQEKNKENQTKTNFEMPDVVKNNPKIPKKYTQFIERVLNTKKNTKDKNNYSGYYGIGKAGAGNTDANAGELLSMMATTMNRKDRAEFFRAVDEQIANAKANGEKLYVTQAWSRSAKENSSAILRMMYDKYGKDYEIAGSAWDIEEEFEALGQDYAEKGYSTDIMFTVKVDGETLKEEISLKQKLKNQRLWNGTLSSAFEDDVLPKHLRQKGDNEFQKSQVKNIENFYTDNQPNINEFLSSEADDFDETLNIVAKQMDNKETNQSLIKDDFREFMSQYKKDLAENSDLVFNRDYVKQNLKSQGKSASKRKMDKISVTLGRMMNEYGDEAAGNFVTGQKNIAKEQAREVAEYINKSDEAKESVLKKVQEKLPLKSVSDGDESIILGEYVINKKTMEGVFGTDDWSQVVEQLKVNPDADPPTIEYQGKVRGKDVVVPITTIGIREDGEGYGGAHKFEMLVAEDFGKNVESVSRDIFGDQEPIVFPDSAATLRSKED